MKNKKSIALLLLFILVLLISSCANRAFSRAFLDFKQAYLSATAFTEPETYDMIVAIQRMDDSLLSTEMRKMKTSLDAMIASAKTEEEKTILSQCSSMYDGLKKLPDLKKKAADVDSMNLSDKGQLNNEIGIMEACRDYLIQGH